MADENEDYEEQVVTKKKDRVMRRTTIRECDVSGSLSKEIIEFANLALDEDQSKQKNVAQFVKQKLDAVKNGTWHVIVGSHFGGNVTNDANTLINFQLDNTWFLVFRSGPPEKAPDAAQPSQ
jgi:hypothetical protein